MSTEPPVSEHRSEPWRARSGASVGGEQSNVVEHAHLMITPGQEAEFEAAYLDAAPVLTGAAGCEQADLFRDSEEPGSYLLRVRWTTLADHTEVFPVSAAGEKFASKVAHYFASDPRVRHFDADAVGS
ncbi:MAG TPA: antibiotic biosynthesis monooxygenase family protein [Pseudonocardia sp.]|nr:antibiotic biosynthesis monooxygenase family protein [Pseudonocardia sp.]